ncbi:hypothetical protein HF086_014274 [Spodoptera exigua]|uniref:FLYWCH-type domain-containing protein n=1 Tax=Spodoptera exigua TaxID=7107 RepID=A0A922SBP4_SPOEX|nr:hypothetical protein HF086_014274 [Spodoptera exigua]
MDKVTPGTSTSAQNERDSIVKFWTGGIEWKRHNKAPDDTLALLNCTLLATKKVVDNLKVAAWPKALQLHLIPKQAFDSIGLARYIKSKRGVVFAIRASKVRDELTIAFEKGMVGCVKLSPPPGCDIKMIVLLYDRKKKIFFGVVPEDQDVLISKLHKLIKNQIKQIAKQSWKGKRILQIAGSSFNLVNFKGKRSYWYCNQWAKGCRASVITSEDVIVKIRDDHNHSVSKSRPVSRYVDLRAPESNSGNLLRSEGDTGWNTAHTQFSF